MSPNPETFLRHLQAKGYHSRSNKHSNALAEAIAGDLLASSPLMAEMARQGRLVYDLNFKITAGTSDWNIDLVLGAPPPGSPPPEAAMPRAPPSTVQLAIEIKSVMTEHRKAVKNRKRDLEAHHEHVHRYNNLAVAAGVLVVNQSATFKSPLRPSVTRHSHPRDLVEHCIREMRGIAGRTAVQGEGLEAKAVLVVDMDNENWAATRYVTQPPAPTVGDPLHYDAFIQAVGSLYEQRFSHK